MANELELLGVILVNFLQIDQRIVYIQLKLRLQGCKQITQYETSKDITHFSNLFK